MLHSIQHIGAALKAARLKAGLSQRALSSKTKIPQNHISKIENGEVNLQASSLVEISRVLGLELMLVPRILVPAFEGIINGTQNSRKQVPMYQLDEQEEDEEDDD